MEEQHDLMTAAEVAKALRISKMTVYRQIEAGALKAVRVGRAFRVKRASVEALLNGSATDGE